MKVIPQRDGKFLLEPLGPKPKVGPNSKASAPKNEQVASSAQGYNRYEPWNFRDLVLSMAKGYCGTPYSMGASLENGNSTDCSGFVQYIYKGFQINMPRCSSDQSEVGQTVTRSPGLLQAAAGRHPLFQPGRPLRGTHGHLSGGWQNDSRLDV